MVVDAGLLHALVRFADAGCAVSFCEPPCVDAVSAAGGALVVLGAAPLDLSDVRAGDTLHVACCNLLTPALAVRLLAAPCAVLVLHGAVPWGVPPGVVDLPTRTPMTTMVWEVLCAMAARPEFEAVVAHDDGGARPAATHAGLARLVCGSKAMGRCPLGGGGDHCAACAGAGVAVNYIDGWTAAAARGEALPACATRCYGERASFLARAAAARDAWLDLVLAQRR